MVKNNMIKKLFSKKYYKVLTSKRKLEKTNKRIAIQVHVFYVDLLDEVYNSISKMPFKYDLFVSTNTKQKQKEILNFFKKKNINVKVEILPNKGRDILPFILQMKKVIKKYDYVCHLHTKKSKYSDFGDDWRHDLYNNLFGCENNIKSIFFEFEHNKKLGLIYPRPYEKIVKNLEIGGNKNNLDKLCKRLGIKNNFKNIFPAGSMFWIRSNILKCLLDVMDESDFQDEQGQMDGTFAHAFERVLVILTEAKGYKYLEIKGVSNKEV